MKFLGGSKINPALRMILEFGDVTDLQSFQCIELENIQDALDDITLTINSFKSDDDRFLRLKALREELMHGKSRDRSTSSRPT